VNEEFTSNFEYPYSLFIIQMHSIFKKAVILKKPPSLRAKGGFYFFISSFPIARRNIQEE